MPPLDLIDDAEASRLNRMATVANTAGSLLGWLEKQQVVQRLSDSTEDELIDALLAEAENGQGGVSYALLVAVIVRRRRSGGIGRMPFDPSILRWAERMWRIARQRASSSSAEEISVYSGPEVEDVKGSSGSTTLYGPHGQQIRGKGE